MQRWQLHQRVPRSGWWVLAWAGTGGPGGGGPGGEVRQEGKKRLASKLNREEVETPRPVPRAGVR